MKFETTVKEIIQRTHDVQSFRFDKLDSFDYKAGQFMWITIKDNGNKLRKHFSFSSSPTEKNFVEFTKKLSDSDFSKALRKLKVGDWAEIDGPFGKFTFEGEHKKIGMLSGGIGITPLISICRYCTDKSLDTKITLLYGNRTPEDIVFRQELEEMQNKNTNMKVVLSIDRASEGWTSRVGFIDSDLIKNEIPDYMDTVFYTCGPPKMVEIMTKILKDLGLPETHIKIENFAGY